MRVLKKNRYGFTLVELIIVVVILAIAALMAVPMLTSAADFQLRAAANMIASDLEYAKNLAVTTQRNYSAVFSTAGDSYQLCDSEGSVIEHPVHGGRQFEVVFQNDSRLNKVDITTVDFDSDLSKTITFDYLGSPYSGSTTANPLNTGTIILNAGDFALTISIESVTGYITIQ